MIEPGAIETNFTANETFRGDDVPPYDELRTLWDGAQGALLGGEAVPGPELVAQAIGDAIENPASPLRVAVGADAEMVIGARTSMDDASFEAAMRGVLGFDW